MSISKPKWEFDSELGKRQKGNNRRKAGSKRFCSEQHLLPVPPSLRGWQDSIYKVRFEVGLSSHSVTKSAFIYLVNCWKPYWTVFWLVRFPYNLSKHVSEGRLVFNFPLPSPPLLSSPCLLALLGLHKVANLQMYCWNITLLSISPVSSVACEHPSAFMCVLQMGERKAMPWRDSPLLVSTSSNSAPV